MNYYFSNYYYSMNSYPVFVKKNIKYLHPSILQKHKVLVYLSVAEFSMSERERENKGSAYLKINQTIVLILINSKY